MTYSHFFAVCMCMCTCLRCVWYAVIVVFIPLPIQHDDREYIVSASYLEIYNEVQGTAKCVTSLYLFYFPYM